MHHRTNMISTLDPLIVEEELADARGAPRTSVSPPRPGHAMRRVTGGKRESAINRFMRFPGQKSSSIGFPVPTMETGRPEASGKCRSRGMPSDSIDRGQDVLGCDRPLLHIATARLARADDSSALQAAAAEQDREAVGPVIAARVAVDQRRAAELARAADQHVVEHPAVVQVFHERGDGRVERRQVFFQVLLDVVVMVPVARVHGDAGAPRLDQAAGQQGPLAVEVAAVAVAQAGVFLRSMSNA